MSVDPAFVLDYAIFCRWHEVVVPGGLSAKVHDTVGDLTRRRPDDAWDLALAVLPTLDDEWAIAFVGVGLLEDLMRDHAPRFIDRLETEVHSDPRMALAVSTMWNNADPINLRFKALVRTAKSRRHVWSMRGA